MRAAGFTGVLRYIGLGREGKQIHRAEYEDYVAHGLGALLVAELGIDDAWASRDDYEIGAARARIAVADARAEGIPDSVGIAWAADSHATTSQVRDAVTYGRGFASVLGARTGAYGFMEVLRAVRAADAASWYWLAGTRPDSEDQKWIQFWQRNTRPTVVVVAGTMCDINETYAPHGAQPLGDDVSFTEIITVASPGNRGYTETHPAKDVVGDTYYWASDIYKAVYGQLLPLLGQVLAAVTAGGVNEDTVKAALKAAVEESMAGLVVPALRAAIPDIEDATIAKIRALLTADA